MLHTVSRHVQPCAHRWLSHRHQHVRLLSSVSSSTQHLLVHRKQQHVLTITINRPDKHNAFNPDTIRELTQAFHANNFPDNSTSPRVVVLQATGSSFCSGADLTWMKEMKNYTTEENHADSERLFDMLRSIFLCPIPVIARVHGAALGGGVGLVAACDMAVAVNSVVFALSEVRLGLSPATISPFVLNKMTFTAASRYFLTGERFTAEEARQCQLINTVAESESVMDKLIESWIANICDNAPHAIRETMRLLRLVAGAAELDKLKPDVCAMIAALRTGDEGQEGLSAFLQKRAPAWKISQPPQRDKQQTDTRRH